MGAVEDEAVSADGFGDAMDAGTDADDVDVVAVVPVTEGDDGSVWLCWMLLALDVGIEVDDAEEGVG